MRTAITAGRGRIVRPRGRDFEIPAPIGGWNARDAIPDMKPTDARTLENFLVDARRIRPRPPSMTWATGLGGPVETLMEFAPASGLSRLFAAAPTAIFDVTALGAVGAAAQTGLSNGRWQHVNFATSGGQYLYCVNGQDAPRHFNGSIWTSPVITPDAGTLSPNNFICVMSHMNRLWFIERSTLKVWYLDARAITGTAHAFDLGSLCPLGGEMMAMSTWTRDGGEGTDDYAVFVTSKGEAHIYAGVDPSSNTTWGRVGRYMIPPPIGRRCMYQLGAELVVLTVQGPVPLSRVMGLSVASAKNTAITDKIAGAFSQAAMFSSGYFGWQIYEYPLANLLLVNVPVQERVAQQQFVFGTRSGAWSKFTGLNGGCWGSLGGVPFFGGNDDKVHRFDFGEGDDNQPILATYEHAFMDLGSSVTKRFLAARPRLVAPPGYVPAVHIRTDFDESPIDFDRTVAATSSGPKWDVTAWDTSPWGVDSVATQGWQSVEGVGSTVSVAFRLAVLADMSLNGMLLKYEPGGTL